jgi:4-amino-4-deoxy-L-arabinose transferase-like glycosyltransferase
MPQSTRSSRRKKAADGRPAAPGSLPTPAFTRRDTYLLGSVLLVALALRLWGIGWGLPTAPEEAYPLKVAWVMSGLSGTGPFTLNPHFFWYPTLYIYLNLGLLEFVRLYLLVTGQASGAPAIRTLYLTDPTSFYLAARSMTACLGALLVLPVYLLGRRAGGRSVAAAGAILVACNPALVSKSQMVDVDIPLALLVTVSLAQSVWLATREELPKIHSWILAGATVGLAASMKYPGVLALIPLLVAIALRARSLSGFLSRALLACLGAAVAFALTSPFVILDASEALRDLGAERVLLELGHFGSERGAAWAFYFVAWFRKLMGWLPGVLALLGIGWFAVGLRPRWAVISGAWIAGFFLAISGWALKADRYLLPVVPAATVFAAAAAGAIFARMRNQTRASLATALVVLVCLVTDLPRWQVALARQEMDPAQAAAIWIEENLPEGSMVVTESYGPRVYSPLTAPTAEEVQRVGRGEAVKRFWLVPVPMFQVEPERAAVYYDPRLYSEADAWVTTGAVRSRYQHEPERFPNQNEFYRWLETHWTEAARFEPPGGAGSEVILFRNPDRSEPFALRVTPPPPPTEMMRAGVGIEGESTFYFNLGGNYYGFGHTKEAAECFETALSFPKITGGVTPERLSSALSLARSGSPAP